MEEQETQEPNETETPKQPDNIERARLAAESLKSENERMEANIKRLEGLKAEQILSGTSNAGQSEPKKEMSNSEYKDYVLKNGRAPEE